MCHHWGCWVCVRGTTRNSSSCWSCFKGSTAQVRCWHSGQVLPAPQKAACQQVWSAGKCKQKGVQAGFTAPQAVTPSLPYSKNCQRWAESRRCQREKRVCPAELCASAGHQVELGDVTLTSRSARECLTHIPYVLLPLRQNLPLITPVTPLLLELSLVPVGEHEVAGRGWKSAASFPCLRLSPLFSKLLSHAIWVT